MRIHQTQQSYDWSSRDASKSFFGLVEVFFNQFAEANLIYPIDFSVTNVSGQDLSNKVNKNGA